MKMELYIQSTESIITGDIALDTSSFCVERKAEVRSGEEN